MTWCNLVTYDAICNITARHFSGYYNSYQFIDLKGNFRPFEDTNAEQLDGHLFVLYGTGVFVYRIEFDMNGDIYRWWEVK